MKLIIENYNKQVARWPQEGYHIMAQYDDEKIVVYQAYRPAIGHYAAKNQFFGGQFSLDRMTWIKPNFLWMMYRSGWGQKDGQTVVLAIHLKMNAFIQYLSQSVYSSFNSSQYSDQDTWQNAIKNSSSRLQWDPDHDVYGAKLPRRAVQIGLRNELIKQYAKDDIMEIEDISDFVNEQFEYVKGKKIDQLKTPKELPLIVTDKKLSNHLKLDINEPTTY